MKWILVTVFLFLAPVVWAADEAPAPPAGKTCTIDASNKPVDEVLKEIALATGETVLTEKLVSGSITAVVKDATIDEALTAVSKACKLQWRKIYVPQGSLLARDANALAAQMRTVLALKFPDILIAPDGAGGSFVHIQKETSADEMLKKAPPTGFAAVYLVTDDEKAYKKELKDESKKKIAKYLESSKELTDEFLAMSPEERKEVLKESMNIYNQLGPEAMQEMMSFVLEMEPEYVAQMNQMGMRAFLNMSPEARQNMLRVSMRQQMEMMKTLTPEEMMTLQQEAAAIAAEMGAGSEEQ